MSYGTRAGIDSYLNDVFRVGYKSSLSRGISNAERNAMNTKSVFTLAGLLTISSAMASSVSPSFDNFGTLSSANFGGSGIPNDAVAIRTLNAGGATITLGLTAHQRYDNPALGNNGAGVFTAQPGSNVKNGTLGALWNFGYYVNVDGAIGSGYTFELLYDFSPTAGTDQSALGAIHLGGSAQGSENLLFDYLNSSTPSGILASAFGLVTQPSGSFDPNASGEYSFALVVSDPTGLELGRSAILVDVASVPDAGSTGLLILLGAGGLFFFAQAQRRGQVAA